MRSVLTKKENEMTPVDAQIMKLCIAGKLYSHALTLGKKVYSVFSPADTGLTPLDVMSYYYYYGFICTTLKQYDRAIQAFRYVLVQPAYVIHQCMVDAYKKYIVVSLLAGKSPDFPKAGSESMKTFLPRICGDYRELIEAMGTVSRSYFYTDMYRKIQECWRQEW